jgi:hypothetical protein
VFDVIVKKATHLVEDNKTTILTGIGVAGTITATVLSGRAGFRAAQILDEEIRKNVDSSLSQMKSVDEPLTKKEMSTKEKIWLVGPQFIPVVGMSAVTVAAIIFANRLSAKETAAMAAMYSMSDKTFQEYKEKVQEKLGQNKEQAVRDEIAQDRVNANPPINGQVIITGSGDVLCYDTLTDRYFESTVENIKRAETAVNLEIVNNDAVPLSRFYDHIGLMPTPFTEDIGWNIDNRCEVTISTVLSKDNKPCLAIDFVSWPKPSFDKVWP